MAGRLAVGADDQGGGIVARVQGHLAREQVVAVIVTVAPAKQFPSARQADLPGQPGGLGQGFVGEAVEGDETPVVRVHGDQPRPRSGQRASTRRFTSSDMRMGVPHSRLVSPGILLVASMPILEPRPETGLAKSR
jgi:hypothetical protein